MELEEVLKKLETERGWTNTEYLTTMQIELIKDILAIVSNQVQAGVMQKIAEAFIRYLRSGNSYAKDNWTVNQIVKYEEDKEYCKTIYNENRLKMNFDDAHDLARTKLFEKIIKETLSGNFSA